MPEVKELADALGYTTVIAKIGPLTGPTELRFIINLESQEALARVALGSRSKADRVFAGEISDWLNNPTAIHQPYELKERLWAVVSRFIPDNACGACGGIGCEDCNDTGIEGPKG